MTTLNDAPTRIPVPGGKIIDEHIGRASTGDDDISIAHMIAPAGWDEPAQTPEFDEHTVVLDGQLIVETDTGTITVDAGRSITTRAGERVRYRVGPQGAEYLAVCRPAFSPERVHREGE